MKRAQGEISRLILMFTNDDNNIVGGEKLIVGARIQIGSRWSDPSLSTHLACLVRLMTAVSGNGTCLY